MRTTLLFIFSFSSDMLLFLENRPSTTTTSVFATNFEDEHHRRREALSLLPSVHVLFYMYCMQHAFVTLGCNYAAGCVFFSLGENAFGSLTWIRPMKLIVLRQKNLQTSTTSTLHLLPRTRRLKRQLLTRSNHHHITNFPMTLCLMFAKKSSICHRS